MVLVANNYQFFSRLASYPVVNDTCQQVTGYYSWAKEKHGLIGSTLELAENGVKKVASTAHPLVERFDEKINYLDNIGCSQLDRLEQSYPVVKKPTTEIVEDSREYYAKTVKPRVEQVMYPVTATYGGISSTIGTVTAYSKEKIDGVVQYGSEKLGKLTQTTATIVDHALDSADDCVERYLPAEQEEEDVRDEEMHPADAGAQGTVAVRRPFNRVVVLSRKIRRNVYAKAMKDLMHLRLRSQEALERLTVTVNVVDYAKTNLEAPTKKAADLTNEFWTALEELDRADENGKEKQDSPEKDELISHVLKLTRRYTTMVNRTVYACSTVAYNHMSHDQKEYVESAKVYVDHLQHHLHHLNEFNQQLFQSSTEMLKGTLESGLDFIMFSGPVSWLIPRYDLDDLNFGLDLDFVDGYATPNGRAVIYEEEESD